jgi:hypothetical protein
MFKIRSLFIIGIVFVISLSGCYYDKEDLLYGNDDCQVDAVSYSMDIEPIINNSCATSGCHVQGGSGNGIFDAYAGVKAKVDNGSFRQRVIADRDMPPGTPLTNCQIKYIEEWLNQGAPNN